MRVLPSVRLVRFVFLFVLAGASPASTVSHAAQTHVVASGETLSSIAENFDVSIAALQHANRLPDPDDVQRGQRLIIPLDTDTFVTCRVKRGETLSKIADRYDLATADILAYNDIRDPLRIAVGTRLRIPRPEPAQAPSPPSRAGPHQPAGSADTSTSSYPGLPPDIVAAIKVAHVTRGRWKNIVVHHSGTPEGSGKGMDRYHREERHMENGLAYHFVIGNGNGMRDGEIFVGNRWKEQLDGGHLAIPALNANSLGICLVGDFQKDKPTRRQMDVLVALTRALMKRAGVRYENVTTHRLIHRKHTECPGKNFPFAAFKKRLK